MHDCTLLSAGAELKTLLNTRRVRKEPFLRVITFRNHHFDETCSHRINMKFCTTFLQIGNLQSPSVPKPLISVLEKNFNRNINEVTISYKYQVKLAHFQLQFDKPYPGSTA